MAYLEKEDYTTSISIEDLDKVLLNASRSATSTQDQLRQKAENWASEQIQGYTAARYEISTELAKTAPDATRSTAIIGCMVDLSLYRIHLTVATHNLPAKREKAYMECLDYLKGVQSGSITLIGVPEVEEPQTGAEVTSQRKFISNPFKEIKLL